jgi:hypothetical protein
MLNNRLLDSYLSASTEVEKKLASARFELEEQKKALLEAKEALIKRIENILPKFVDSAISTVVSFNAPRVEQMSIDEIRKMKEKLETEKTGAIEAGIDSLRSCPDWLWCPQSSTSTSSDPIDSLGITYEGAIWKSFENYSQSLERILAAHGLKIEEGYRRSPFKPWFLSDEELKELNKTVGRAHQIYCATRSTCRSLEDSLKAARARETDFHSVLLASRHASANCFLLCILKHFRRGFRQSAAP